jgi:hypothetical protein
MKSKISRHDLLQYYLKAAFELVQCFVASLHRQLRRLAEAEKSAKLRSGCRITRPQLAGAKVSKSNFGPNSGNSLDISKGIYQLGMCEFKSSQVSHAFQRSAKLPKESENRPEIPAFRAFALVSGLPFCGDYRRRLGSIRTAARPWQSSGPDLHGIGNLSPGLAARST